MARAVQNPHRPVSDGSPSFRAVFGGGYRLGHSGDGRDSPALWNEQVRLRLLIEDPVSDG